MYVCMCAALVCTYLSVLQCANVFVGLFVCGDMLIFLITCTYVITSMCVSALVYCALVASGVVCALKSWISVVHLVTASQNMAAMDIAQRAAAARKSQ